MDGPKGKPIMWPSCAIKVAFVWDRICLEPNLVKRKIWFGATKNEVNLGIINEYRSVPVYILGLITPNLGSIVLLPSHDQEAVILFQLLALSGDKIKAIQPSHLWHG